MSNPKLPGRLVCQRFARGSGDSWEIRAVDAEYRVFLNGDHVATTFMPDLAYDILDAHGAGYPGPDLESSMGR